MKIRIPPRRKRIINALKPTTEYSNELSADVFLCSIINYLHWKVSPTATDSAQLSTDKVENSVGYALL